MNVKLLVDGIMRQATDLIAQLSTSAGVRAPLAHRDHPMREEVFALLDRVQQEADALWLRVANYNDEHPVSEEARRAFAFYFGQSFDDFTLADPDWREE